jgi:hypothetical protein
MKLSMRDIDIERAFADLLSSFNDIDPINDFRRAIQDVRVRRDLARSRHLNVIPRIIPTYTPQETTIPIKNKEKLLLLAAFEAAYHHSPTPITPDMVPIIIDTGASVTVTP